MNEGKWPEDYQTGVNSAVQISLNEGIEKGLSMLKLLEQKFVNHPNFIHNGDDLKRSIVRNVILVLTLSCERKAEEALRKLLDTPSSLIVFPVDEREQLLRSIQGKLSGTEWHG